MRMRYFKIVSSKLSVDPTNTVPAFTNAIDVDSVPGAQKRSEFWNKVNYVKKCEGQYGYFRFTDPEGSILGVKPQDNPASEVLGLHMAKKFGIPAPDCLLLLEKPEIETVNQLFEALTEEIPVSNFRLVMTNLIGADLKEIMEGPTAPGKYFGGPGRFQLLRELGFLFAFDHLCWNMDRFNFDGAITNPRNIFIRTDNEGTPISVCCIDQVYLGAQALEKDIQKFVANIKHGNKSISTKLFNGLGPIKKCFDTQEEKAINAIFDGMKDFIDHILTLPTDKGKLDSQFKNGLFKAFMPFFNMSSTYTMVDAVHKEFK